MKHTVRGLLVFFVLSIPSVIHADTLSLTTYYPAPFGSYSLLRLNPVTDASMGACDGTKIGQIYYSSDTSELKTCTGASWSSAGPWTRVSGTKNVYLTNSPADTAYKVGIGVNPPQARMHIKGADDATNGQLRIESTGSDAKFALFNSSGSTTTGNASIAMSNTAGSEGLRFMINNVDKMILDENGNVGVGVTAPNTNLHLSGPDNASYGQLQVQSTGNDAGISLYNANGASATGRGDILMSRSAGTEGLRFMINGADKMVLDETGNLGVGVAAPTELLTVRKDQAGTATIVKVINSTNAASSQARFDLATGSANSYAIISLSELGAGTSALNLSTGDGVTGGMYLGSGSALTNIPIIFRQGASERARINSAGNVGIGEPAPAYKLHVNGPIGGALESGSTNVGELKVDCTSTPGSCYAVYAP